MTAAFAIVLMLQGAVPVSATEPCRVLLTQDRVDPTWYEQLQEIRFTKRRNPSSEAARKDLAKRAHKVGADAVIDIDIESKRTVFSFPHSIIEARGRAVKWTAVGRERSFELRGSCYGVKGKPVDQVARVPERVINDGFGPSESSELAKPKKKIPWGPIVAAAVVGTSVLAASQGSGTTFLPPDATTPVPPTFVNNSSLWIDTVSSDGSVVVLSDGSVWSVDLLDQIRTSLWLPVQRVTIANGQRYGQFVMVKQGVRAETATVTRVR